MPSGGDEIDAGRADGGVAELQLVQFFAAAGSVFDARAGLARACRRLAPQPLRLAANLVGDRLLLPRLGVEECLTLLDEVVVGARGAKGAARIDAADLHHVAGNCAQKSPIVGGDQVAERRRPEQPLQPDDAGQIEVVGRLIEQQQVGLAHELAGQGKPFAPAAGKMIGPLIGIAETDLRQRDRRPGFALVILDRLAGKRGQKHRADAQTGSERVVLGQVTDARAAPQGTRAGVGLLKAGQQFQERRFAGAVRSDQPQALAVVQIEGQIGE